MPSKKELKKDEYQRLNKSVDAFFNSSYRNDGQSKWGSLFEAHTNAIIGAPPAIIAHILLLITFSDFAKEQPALFATAIWPVFFYLSVARMWIFRRIFEKYNVQLEPIILFRNIWLFFRHGKA